MFNHEIINVIPEKNIVCVSPHYDDFLFFLGGYVMEMKKNKMLETKRFTVINAFSRNNYLKGDIEGNKDRSLARVQFVTGIRLIEELECLDDLLGRHAYIYRILGEESSRVRGKSFSEKKGEMEMAYGSYESMESCDWEILDRIKACIKEIAVRPDTALIFPLTMKGHIDHFIVRESALRAKEELGESEQASFYFAEDKPYAGLLNEEEIEQTIRFTVKYGLIDLAFVHHPEEMIRMAFLHYPSQVDEIYRIGIRTRDEQLRELYKVECHCDRIFKMQ